MMFGVMRVVCRCVLFGVWCLVCCACCTSAGCDVFLLMCDACSVICVVR